MHFAPPFQGNNQMQIALKIQSGIFDNVNSQYSQDLNNFVAWCLSKDAKLRPTVEDILGRPEIYFIIR